MPDILVTPAYINYIRLIYLLFNVSSGTLIANRNTQAYIKGIKLLLLTENVNEIQTIIHFYFTIFNDILIRRLLQKFRESFNLCYFLKGLHC